MTSPRYDIVAIGNALGPWLPPGVVLEWSGGKSFVPAAAWIVALLAIQGVALMACGVFDSRPLLLVAIVVYGGTLGSFVTMQALLIAEAFGVSHYAQIYAMARFLSVLGVLIGPGLMGLLHQRTGDYLASFVTVSLISVLGAMVLASAGPTPRPCEHCPT